MKTAYRVHKGFWAVLVACMLAPVFTRAQTCTIVGPTSICLGELAVFGVNASAVPTSYAWDFGDGSTSSQPNPGYNYSAHATRTVKVVLTLTGGGTCTATQNVTIHPKPVSNFNVLPSSSNCFSKNQICISDNSTPGPTGNSLAKRIFLWDDGAGDNTANPGANKILCHKYQQTGSYTLVMEITDDKGCLSKVTQKIDILPDYKVTYNQTVLVATTDCKYTVCFYNNTLPADTVNIGNYTWDFGDGTTSSAWTDYKAVCHDYPNKGTYFPKLIVRHKSGCADTAASVINVTRPDFNFNLTMPDKLCWGKNATFFNDASNPGAKYRWFYKDSASGREEPMPDQTNPVTFSPPFPGKFYIKLNMLVDSCHKNAFDTILFMCPKADFKPENHHQCEPGDTTYFCDNSCYDYSYNLYRMWDFGHGDSCVTDTKNGQNVNRNCRYSVDKQPKHLYGWGSPGAKFSCYDAKLFLKDSVTGCESEGAGKILLGMPPLDNLTLDDTAIQYCTDLGAIDMERMVTFKIDGLACNNSWDLWLNYDSAYKVDNFIQVKANPPPQNLYFSVADPKGDVTIGLIVGNGNRSRFSSCGNIASTDGKLCADTVWYHHKLNVAEVPDPYISYFPDKACAPFNFIMQVDDTIQYGVSKILWNWGDGNADSIYLGPNDSIIPTRYYTYWKNGLYTPFITLENSRRCQETQYLSVLLGYDQFADYDSIVCAGDSVEITPYYFYYDKADQLWIDSARNAQGKEMLWWDIDDGNGFVTKKPATKLVFPHEGEYHVRIASKDSTNCRDTLFFTVKAVKAEAHIADMADTFYCNDNIVRFHDSSFGSPYIPGDVVTQWLWNFGDGKNNSYLEDPFHFYNVFGLQDITLIVKSKAGCRDTARRKIMIVGPQPRFEIITDSIGCDPLKVTFKNTSDKVKTMIWKMGDPANTIINTDKDTNITFIYTPPGVYNITLYGADSIYNPATGNTYFCEATYPDTPLVKQVRVLPNYPVNFDIPDTICQSDIFLLRSLSDARYDYFRWWMGNGDSIFTDSAIAKYNYLSIGTYKVDFKPTYTPSDTERLCILDTFKNITVIPIKADFEISALSRDPVFYFTNKSNNAVRYEWDFGHPQSGKANFSALKDPSHNFKVDKGPFWVCLRAYNQEGCVDTVCKPVENKYVPRLFIPNVFTPGTNDTLNNRFDIDIFLATTYHLSIFNRWGEKVFETYEDGEGNSDLKNWSGIHQQTGEPCPSGVYYVLFDYEIFGIDEPTNYHGTLTLFREQ